MSAYSELIDILAQRRDERVISDVMAKGLIAARSLGRGRMAKALPKAHKDGKNLVAATRSEVAKDKKRPDLVQVLNAKIDEHIAKGEYHKARVCEAMRNRVNP